MARFIKTVSPGGVSTCVVGCTGATICGQGTYITNIPGTWTPISVCRDWTTPFCGNIAYAVNFSCYEMIKFEMVGSSNICECYFDNMYVNVMSCEYYLKSCGSNFCICNAWSRSYSVPGSCTASSTIPYINLIGACKCRHAMVNVCFSPGNHDAQCCKLGSGIFAHSQSTGQYAGSYFEQWGLSHYNLLTCTICAAWPPHNCRVATAEELGCYYFSCIVIRNNYCCWTPYGCGSNCLLPGAYFGVWGIPRPPLDNPSLCSTYFVE